MVTLLQKKTPKGKIREKFNKMGLRVPKVGVKETKGVDFNNSRRQNPGIAKIGQ